MIRAALVEALGQLDADVSAPRTTPPPDRSPGTVRDATSAVESRRGERPARPGVARCGETPGSARGCDGQEWTDAIRYRIAYGKPPHGPRPQRFDHGWGREFARSGMPAAELESEIVRRLEAVDETTLEMIREAIADALAGRRPRW